MDTKKFLLATVVGFVGNTIAYMIMEQVIFKSYMDKTIYQPTGASPEAVILGPLVAVLVMMLIMAYIYPKGYQGGSPLMEGLRFGVLLGLFSGVPFGIFFNAMFSVRAGPTFVLILDYTVELTVAGVLIGLIYGQEKTAE